MKFTFMSLNYLPSTGGLISYINNFSKYLFEVEGIKKDDIRVISTDGKDSTLKSDSYVNGFLVKRIRAFKFNKAFYLFSPLKVTRNIIKDLKKMKFEKNEIIVIRHLYFAFAINKVFKNKAKTIYILPLIAPRLQRMNISQVGIIKKLYYFFIIPQLYYIEKYALKNIENIAVLSESKKKELANYYNISENKIEVIYPGVDTEKYKPLSNYMEKKEILKEFGLLNLIDSKIIITVCRLTSEKNISFLIKALEKIDDVNFKLIIVGDGPLRADIEKEIVQRNLKNKIILLGFRTDVELLYRISDVFVLPSKYEGFGHVFLEALSSGVPCIGLKNNPPEFITATEEIIENGKNGFYVNGNNSLELSNCLNGVLNNDKLLYELKLEARKSIERKFTWDKHLEGIIKKVSSGE